MLMDRLNSLSESQRRGITVFFSIVSAAVVVILMVRAATYYMMDVEVFQDAGWALRRGQDLYSEHFPTRSGYRFIYPPFAALLFYPLTWAGPTTLQIIWTGATIAAVWAMLWMVATRLKLAKPTIVATALLGLAMLTNPLWANVNFGQINVFLALLIVSDVLGFLPKQLRGLGIGIAAGIKITPAAYALIFLVRKDYRAVLLSAMWFFVTAIIGFLLRFDESIYYWTDEFFSGDRGGAPTYEANQAMSGLLARAGITDPTLNMLTMGFFLLGAIAAAYCAWVLERRGQSVAALAMVALAASFAGPYAVSHHWSITIVFLPMLLVLRKPWQLIIGVLFFIAQWWAPYNVFVGNPDGLATNPFEWAYGGMQGIMGFVVMVAFVYYAMTRRKAQAVTTKDTVTFDA
ncbi:glycosyltransferase family 87 protein [Corynebacterium sp. H113]|uniref:glycosyltransferase family 87 protein n=1 Tax=Corynebacterium sp. H113 TaxID=3133419 RepID=UPI0030B43532